MVRRVVTRVRTHLLPNFCSPFLNLISHGKAFIFNKNEGNNQKVENKEPGRDRVGVVRALLSQ